MRVTLGNLFCGAVGFALGALVVPFVFLHSSSCRDCLDPNHVPNLGDLGCVCGERAEELKRLSRIAMSYHSPVDSARAEPETVKAQSRLTDLDMESEDEMREFMFPRHKEPMLNFINEKDKQRKLGAIYEPLSLQQEYSFRKMLFVGVLTQQSYLPTRAKYLYETWGKEVDKLVFFVGEDCVIPPNLTYLPIVKLEGIPDNVYPPLRKTFAVMKYMYDNYVDQFRWFIRADDDMYVRTKWLNEILAKMNPEERVFLGRAGTGRKEDLDRLRLLPHERYCMGGPGIIISVATLRQLGPHLSNCFNAVLLYSKSDYNDDDVEVGRCISRKVNIQCSSSKESRLYFLYDYDKASLNPVTLWTQPYLQHLITLHPVKKAENMLSVHHFYKMLDFEEAYKHVQQMANYLNKLCQQLPSMVSPPLYASAGCNVTLHPHLTEFSTSVKFDHLTPVEDFVHRKAVPFVVKPVDKFDVQYWTRFNDSSVQSVGVDIPEHAPHGSLMAEVMNLLSVLRPYVEAQFPTLAVEVKHILDGYVRYNPHLGREYILTLKIKLQKRLSSKYVYRRYHVVREVTPEVAVVDLPSISPELAVNIILPLANVDASFVAFLQSLGHVGLRFGENAVHLVLVVFSEGDAAKAEKTLHDYSSSSFPISASIAVHEGAFNAFKGFDIGMATLEDNHSVAFLADVKVRFGSGFFRRCRSNPVLGKRVYFPTVFWLYKSDGTNSSFPPQITSWSGQWAYYDHYLSCIYKGDYDSLNGYQGKKYSVEFLEAVIASHLAVMQAPEPGLFRDWGKRSCKALTSTRRRKICFELKKRSSFDQVEWTNYIAELSSKKDDFLKIKDPSLL